MTDFLCPAHGGLSHILVHESAHAVVAIDRGVRFTNLRIHDPVDWPIVSGQFMAGAVYLDLAYEVSPRASFDVALAGVVAERGAFGHELENGWTGDVSGWRTRHGLTAGDPDAVALQAAVGCSIAEARRDLEVWLTAHFDQVRAVATALMGVDASTTVAPAPDLSGGRELSESQVADVLGVALPGG